ncbi:MAG: hypothetical protein ACI9XB_002668 [Gammaproteobacteria bacterium]|jgi:hypothetical protein
MRDQAKQQTIITESKSWVERVVIGCNFCPFAGKAFIENKIHFEVVHSEALNDQLESILLELQRLDSRDDLETTLILFPSQFLEFESYLDFVSLAEGLLVAHDYEGVYQIASFHPNYIFAGSDEDDPANFTNRSPYSMVHLLRESSVSKAVDLYPDVDAIPERNIDFARKKGLEGMKKLLEKK